MNGMRYGSHPNRNDTPPKTSDRMLSSGVVFAGALPTYAGGASCPGVTGFVMSEIVSPRE
jgi:hypothetical protein